jgi:hypothetical protein
LWFVLDDPQLSAARRSLIEDPVTGTKDRSYAARRVRWAERAGPDEEVGTRVAMG